MTSTPPGRWFNNRPLPRPGEDLEDQGLGFDVQTLIDRRQMLTAMGLGTLAFTLSACAPTAGTGSRGAAEIPEETAGPYPADGSNGPDVLERSGIVRSDIRSSFDGATGTAQGIEMQLQLRILDSAKDNAPMIGVAVYVWQCDRQGRYSMYSTGVQEENYLRGVQLSDQDGMVRFTSIFPACYAGRWPHIHFEIYPDEHSVTDAANAIATSQVALPQEACEQVYATVGYEPSVKNLAAVSLRSDNVFGDDAGASQLAAVTGSNTEGYRVSLEVPVDTRTTPGTGQEPGAGERPGARPPTRPAASAAP